MKLFKCSTCDKILEEKYVSNHPASKITWLDASEHEDRIKEIDELQENSNEEEIKKQEEKKKKLESYKAELRDLDDDELNKILESLRAELEELKEKLKPEKETKEASRKNYDVLLLEPYQDNTKPGDELLIRLGSTDEQTKGNSKDDDLLKQLGSVD